MKKLLKFFHLFNPLNDLARLLVRVWKDTRETIKLEDSLDITSDPRYTVRITRDQLIMLDILAGKGIINSDLLKKELRRSAYCPNCGNIMNR